MEEITAAGLLFFFFYAEDVVMVQVSSQAETTADVAEITAAEASSG